MTESLQLSGYDDRKALLAQRYHRAGKSLFIVSLPLHLVATHLPIPDPEKPFEGNRRVNMTHASKFGEYWRENLKWATPPLLVDTTFPLSSDFEAKYEAGGVEFGILKMPHNSQAEFDILDGQHRILGWKLINDRIVEQLKAAREELIRSRSAANEEGIAVYEQKIKNLNADLDRLRTEYITLEILEGVTVEEHKQAFHDIAVNAKGITKSLTVSFDRRSILNRVALALAESHDLLAGKVDFEKDRVLGSNENLISGRNLADIVRHVAVGIDGRMTVRREKSFKESAIEGMAKRFLDALVDSFPDLKKISTEDLHPTDLRNQSLLGSSTILRVLAGAYHNLAVDLADEDDPLINNAGDAKARKLFAGLAGSMGFPVAQGWLDTECFPDADSRAPSSRAQDLKDLTQQLTAWGQSSKVFVKPTKRT